MPLEREDQKHLLAAQGYVELGMFLEADAELEEIDPGVRHLPEVLEVRIRIYQGLEKWRKNWGQKRNLAPPLQKVLCARISLIH